MEWLRLSSRHEALSSNRRSTKKSFKKCWWVLVWMYNHDEKQHGGSPTWSKYHVQMYENRKWNLLKLFFKKRDVDNSNRGSEFNKGTFYACIEVSQWNPFVQYKLIKIREKIKLQYGPAIQLWIYTQRKQNQHVEETPELSWIFQHCSQ
jgi:hypothetical protein